ncbi:zinc finger protein 239-like isoform X2 [Periplaneta americana]
MDLIKTEPEFDPLLIQSINNADTEHTSHLSEGQIAVQCNTSNCDVKWEVKAEQSVEPNTFSSLKFEPEADTFDFVTVKEEAKLEVMQEESEVLTESTLKRDGHAAPDKPTRVGNSVSAGNSAYDTQIYEGERNLQAEDAGESSQKCNTCGKLLPDLQSHVCKRNDDKRYKCDICGKCLANSSTLKAHLRIHTGEKPYICDVCGKCFSLSGTIRRHARLHTGEKPYKCDYCGKCFSMLSYLKLHLCTHTGERPFKCQVCGTCFAKQSALKAHLLTHNEVKLFPCDKCGKLFSQSLAVRINSRFHLCGECKDPFKCGVCGISCLHLEDLKSHVRTHKD